MKLVIRDRRVGDKVVEANSIYLYDGKDNQYRISLNKFGELEIQSTDGGLIVEPNVSNEITIKTK